MTEGYGDYSQIMFRNQHGGVQWEKTKITAERTKRERLRSTPDMRLMASLEENGVSDAFVEVRRAFDAIVAEVKASQMRLDGYGRTLRPDDYGAVLQIKYREWIIECERNKKLFPKIAVEIIGHGSTPNSIDEKYRTYHGKALQNLISCLEVWVSMGRG